MPPGLELATSRSTAAPPCVPFCACSPRSSLGACCLQRDMKGHITVKGNVPLASIKLVLFTTEDDNSPTISRELAAWTRPANQAR